MKDNIVLIGFMGVGKGRTARALADATGMFAVDCDDLIESRMKMKIRNIFSDQGEPVFREMEYRLGLWMENNLSGTIISTGGGFYKVENLRRIGKVVYLHADVENIIQTILDHPNAKKKIKKRPLLQDMDKAKELFNLRLPGYRAVADAEVNVHGLPSTMVADRIISLLGLPGRCE